MPYTPTSTIIIWAGQSMNYIWDSVTGFFYQAGGAQFTIVIILAFFTVCLVIVGIKTVFESIF
jgi:hypothetical protein